MSAVLAARRLRDLAAQDPTVAPLALLQAEALDASADPSWAEAVPEFRTQPPLLDGTTVRLAPERVSDLFTRLGAALEGDLAGVAGRVAPDPLGLLAASVTHDHERVRSIAQALGVQLAPLAVLGQVATLPLLLACGARAVPLLTGLSWEHGSCPVCGAWPTLLEVRGLERQRWLRCGRCGSGWNQINALCAFCGTDDYRSQSYLAPEAERQTRQALTCGECRGYVKGLTTLGALDPGEVLLRDLLSLELDVAALEQGYARPEEPPTRLSVSVEPQPACVSRS